MGVAPVIVSASFVTQHHGAFALLEDGGGGRSSSLSVSMVTHYKAQLRSRVQSFCAELQTAAVGTEDWAFRLLLWGQKIGHSGFCGDKRLDIKAQNFENPTELKTCLLYSSGRKLRCLLIFLKSESIFCTCLPFPVLNLNACTPIFT